MLLVAVAVEKLQVAQFLQEVVVLEVVEQGLEQQELQISVVEVVEAVECFRHQMVLVALAVLVS
jgi:hypothetical protein